MSGPIALHGGGEFLAGDEPFLDALLEAAGRPAATRVAGADDLDDVVGHAFPSVGLLVRIVIASTAAARGRPGLAAANGRRAFDRRASVAQLRIDVEEARIVDASSAADPRHAERLTAADLIYFPGGDPDLIPSIIPGTAAAAALHAAWTRGAVLAGASAGAMALGEWTWTPGGGIAGLGFVRGVAVVPHYDEMRRTRWQQTLDDMAPGGLGYLGLDERTGVIGEAGQSRWLVVGEGAAHWFAAGAAGAVTGRHGDRLALPA
jgi:cyanophycinase-like exopeptidase